MVDFSLMTLPKSYETHNKDYSLFVWGEYWEKIPDTVSIENFTVDSLQKLNFDGGYVALYKNHRTGDMVVFRSHSDTFSLFWFEQDGTLFFSDDYFLCLKRFDSVTWNLDSVSDFFEGAWNNICKYNRTPFKEISKLDTWEYMIVRRDGTKECGSWKHLPTERIYTEKNLDIFKRDFFSAIDFYLQKIHEKTNGNVALSLSAGIDSNTLAARWCQLYPQSEACFFTSKINDVTDESQIASAMQSVVTKPIEYVQIKTDTGNFVELLHAYMQKHTPPRFINELSEADFVVQLKNGGITLPHINGMGADGLFGEFGNEYMYLVREKLACLKLHKARKIFAAVQRSFNYKNVQGGGGC